MSSPIADKALDLRRLMHYLTLKDTEGRNMARKTQEKAGFRTNLILYYAAIGVILLGYVFLSIGDANSLTSLTLGPVVLVVGYLIAIPIALLAGLNRPEIPAEQTESSTPQTRTGRQA